VRLITATNRDLPNQIASGAFREDLYFRLNVIRLAIPPLRERVDDIPLLVDYFADIYSRQHRVPRPEITAAAMDALLQYRWPGNIRELKNVLERLTLKASGQEVRPTDLPSDVRPAIRPQVPVRDVPLLPSPTARVDEMLTRMLQHGESFWSVVYPIFMSRDMTRDDLRRIVQVGLESTNGNYRLLVQLFNMAEDDYKRFLGFLRKHNCHLPFQRFRVVPSRLTAPNAPPRPMAAAKG
jgi:DNA-binding NtrC family response regulator